MTGATDNGPQQSPGDTGTFETGGLHEAIRDLTSELSLELVLQKVADLSRKLVGASYSALALLDDQVNLAQFITSARLRDTAKYS